MPPVALSPESTSVCIVLVLGCVDESEMQNMLIPEELEPDMGSGTRGLESLPLLRLITCVRLGIWDFLNLTIFVVLEY